MSRERSLSRRDVVIGGAVAAAGALGLAALTPDVRNSVLNSLDEGRERVFEPRIRSAGFLDGDAYIRWEAPDEGELEFREKPFLREGNVIQFGAQGGSTGDEISANDLILQPKVPKTEGIRVRYPELVRGENPDPDDEGGAYWIRLEGFVEVRRGNLTGKRDAYVRLSQSNLAHIRLEPQTFDFLDQEEQVCSTNNMGDEVCTFVDENGDPISPQDLGQIESIPLEDFPQGDVIFSRL